MIYLKSREDSCEGSELSFNKSTELKNVIPNIIKLFKMVLI